MSKYVTENSHAVLLFVSVTVNLVLSLTIWFTLRISPTDVLDAVTIMRSVADDNTARITADVQGLRDEVRLLRADAD